jgi:hypothetical protein
MNHQWRRARHFSELKGAMARSSLAAIRMLANANDFKK